MPYLQLEFWELDAGRVTAGLPARPIEHVEERVAGTRREAALMRTLTAREMDIMSILWELESATVSEVRERLADDLAYNTVLSMLRIMEDKGIVGHRKVGRAHRYHPLVARREAVRAVLGRLCDKLFKGSPELLMTHLVEEEPLSPGAVRRLREQLDQRLRKEGER